MAWSTDEAEFDLSMQQDGTARTTGKGQQQTVLTAPHELRSCRVTQGYVTKSPQASGTNGTFQDMSSRD